jgi:hypothetical protein
MGPTALLPNVVVLQIFIVHKNSSTSVECNGEHLASRPAVANRWFAGHWWSARKFWWSVEKFGHYLQSLCLLYCFIIWFQTSSNKYHTNNFAIIKQVHFILIKWNFYDHYFIDVRTSLKKFILVAQLVSWLGYGLDDSASVLTGLWAGWLESQDLVLVRERLCALLTVVCLIR